MLSEIIVGQLYLWLIVFARLGGAFSTMPIYGDPFVLPQARLMLALVISVLVTPLVSELIPRMPVSLFGLAWLIIAELVIGIFLGTIPRLMFSALDTAGIVIAVQTSLANAAIFNPAFSSQATLPGVMLGLLGILLVFATNLHHLMILAVIDSYSLFVPGAPLPVSDFADMISHLVSRSFVIGVEMSAPFLISGLLLALALGLLARVAPQIQVFFVFMSGQIAFGLFLIMITLSAMMLFWLKFFEDGMVRLLNN